MKKFKTQNELLAFVTSYMITEKQFAPIDLNDPAFLITPSDVIDFISEFLFYNEFVEIIE